MRVAGIDEVGRGCWAGPLVACAVVLGPPIEGLRDSKKLSKLQRERIAAEILISASAVGIGWVWPEEIDSIGITKSVRLAMQRAYAEINLVVDLIVIDGNINYLSEDPRAQSVVKADDSVPAVSAASIVAKVARDKYMAEMHHRYPAYNFNKNVGYGTAVHQKALQENGVTILHRKSFRPIKDRA